MSAEFKRAAELAVGSALLFRKSPNGGSHGRGLDQKRASTLADEGLTGEELYALLLDVAKRAGELAEGQALDMRYRIVDEVRRLAEASDSLSLHRFIEKEAKA